MTGQGGEGLVRQELVGDVAVIVLANPPVNALSNALRAGLSDALSQAIAAPEVRAIVIRGEGRGFCAGADISEFGKPRTALRLGDLCLAIEASPKPVVAAIHGMALGGGMELALAAHYRVAEEGAVLGLPEVNLGILPGAGGTQRLPRLVGAREALKLMLTGVPITAQVAAGLGLIDRIVAADPTGAAVTLAGEVSAPRPTGDRRDGFSDARAYMAAVTEARAAEAGNRLPAPGRIVDLVEAALLFPLAQGLLAEEAAFADLVATPEAAGLRHAFFAERRAMTLPPALAQASLPKLATLGLWGTGEDVVALAQQALAAGLRVVLGVPEREALQGVIERLARRQEAEVQAGRSSAEARDADWARLTPATAPEALDGLDLVLREAEAELPRAHSARWTSAAIGPAGPRAPEAVTVAPGRSGLAELGQAPGTRADVLIRLMALARRLNWRLVPVGPGGPVELGLRLSLAGAIDHLAAQGIASADRATEVLGRWLRARRVARPPYVTEAEEGRIIATCLAAMAAEGARMIEDGRAARPATVDGVALMAGLVPRWQGGPMFQADRRGLLVLRRDLIALAENAQVFMPAELFDRLIAEGRNFASLNEARAPG